MTYFVIFIAHQYTLCTNILSSRLILTNLDIILFLIHFKGLMDPCYAVDFIIKVVGNGVNEGFCKTGDSLHVVREYDNAHGR